ncbi:dihydrofolate reductase family protein [Paraclostridium bifermentans]|uniref:dihydrofolate reductase family protein n=1 Tax=Paraclostridium bifermentans TaxID=1490 RepID=UPI0034DE99F3
MSKKIILNLAISIDGYIASEDGGFEWIVGDGDKSLDTEKKWDFNGFLDTIDVVVMGKNCYDQNFHKDFKNKKVYVATSKDLKDYENIHFIKGDIVKKIEKNIFLFGGGKAIDPFIKANIIDEYIIGIIPTILGKGRKLFLENNPKIDLHLDEYITDEGVVILRYSKR